MNWDELAAQILVGALVFGVYELVGFQPAALVALVLILIAQVDIITALGEQA